MDTTAKEWATATSKTFAATEYINNWFFRMQGPYSTSTLAVVSAMTGFLVALLLVLLRPPFVRRSTDSMEPWVRGGVSYMCILLYAVGAAAACFGALKMI